MTSCGRNKVTGIPQDETEPTAYVVQEQQKKDEPVKRVAINDMTGLNIVIGLSVITGICAVVIFKYSIILMQLKRDNAWLYGRVNRIVDNINTYRHVQKDKINAMVKKINELNRKLAAKGKANVK
jgi:hypothetical protein